MAAGSLERRRWTRAALAVLILGPPAALVLRLVVPRRVPAPRAAASRPSVAVLGFRSLSGGGDASWLSQGLPEMLVRQMSAAETYRVIPRENVTWLPVESPLPEAESLPPDALALVRSCLGPDLVVVGAYQASEKGRLRVELRVQDAVGGATLAEVSVSGGEADVLDLVRQANAQLFERMGAAPPGAGSRLPATPDAARLYSDGVGKLRLFDAQAARPILEKAVAADPGDPFAHLALAEAWSVLGHDAHAREETSKASLLADGLPRADRLFVRARYQEAERRWADAVRTYGALWAFFPDDVEYGLRLAEAQVASGAAAEAIRTVDDLRRLPRPASEDPRIDLAEARAAETLGDFRRAQEAAALAARNGTSRGARLLVARARLAEVYSLRSLGRVEEALAAAGEAKAIFATAGDRGGVARALLQAASVLRYRGDLARTQALAEQALATSQEIGQQAGVAEALNRLGGVAAAQGRLRDARGLYERSLALWRELGHADWEATALNNVGTTLRQLGDLAAARRMLEQALTRFRTMEDRQGTAFAGFNLGFVLLDSGQLAEARRAFEESRDVAERIGEKSLAAVAEFGLGTVAGAEGDLATARQRHAEALAIRKALGEKNRVAESLLALGFLALDEGRAPEAEASAREAAEVFAREQERHNEALAHVLLARAALARGATVEAQAAMARAEASAQQTEHKAARLAVDIAAARTRAAALEVAAAAGRLRSLAEESSRTGLPGLALEARLAAGELEIRYGDTRAGIRALGDVETEATARGYGLLARQARALARTAR